MKILVTGASGFIGSVVARLLTEAGNDVRVMLRGQSDTRNLQGLEVERVEGDLNNADSLAKAIDGCNALYHVAADYRLWTPDPKTLYTTNVDGTRALMLAALKAGLERIVYTSSVATLGILPDGQVSDEATPSSLVDMVGHYKRSKFLAEQEVQKLIAEQNLPAVIVMPSTPVGPGDRRPTPTGRMVLDAANGKMPAYVDTGLNIVHVDDVAKGHLLAFEKGRVGERYILGGTDMTLQSILAEIADITHRKPPRWRLPVNLIMPVAYVSEAYARLTKGGEPRVTVDGLRMARKLMFFSSHKAQQELGYQARPVREALQDAIDWYRQNGYCGKT